MITVTDVLSELEAAGTEQTRRTYRRHGVRGAQFGVKYGDLERLRKRIKTDHALALALWASGNHDARILATKTADPLLAGSAMVDAWAADLDSALLVDAFVEYVARTALARAKADAWATSPDEQIGRAGWHLIARLAGSADDLPDVYFEAALVTIEREIHSRANRTREAMNNALIAIGIRSDALERRALAVAAAVGSVNVDHGETSCKTPDAAAYIRRTLAHRARKAGAGAA